MLQNIPTHVIAGPLGAGKTTLIRHLLAQRPANERWAVLINEFGLVGLDAALLSRDEDGIAIGEVAGGCLCCVNGMPFQVGLGRLLRKSRPDRLFIEPSGLGHPLQLLAQLKQAPWAGVLTIQPLLMVVDAQSMVRNEPLPEAQQQAFNASEYVVFNKAEAVDEKSKLLITNKFNDKNVMWSVQGQVPLSCLPGALVKIVDSPFEENQIVDNPGGAPTILWTDPSRPICLAQEGEGGWSIGWRWHPAQQFYPQRLQAFLGTLPWRRAKGVIHSVEGWLSFNGLKGDMPMWKPSKWRRDSRIELIFDQPQSQPTLQAGLSECRVS
jgi:G3E family GTPase